MSEVKLKKSDQDQQMEDILDIKQEGKQDQQEKEEEQEEGDQEGEEYEDDEEEEEEEEEFQMADFSKVEQAEQLIKKVMNDKELEYRFLLEIKSRNYDEAEFIAAKILAKDQSNETILLFWDMLRKYKKEFYQMDEEERVQDEEEDEQGEEGEGEDEWEEVDEYDYNDGEEYEDEYEVEDDEDGWKTEDEYDTDEKEDEDEEDEEEEDEEEEEIDQDEQYEEEDEEEEQEEIEKEQKDQVDNKKKDDQTIKKPAVIKKKERNAKTELIQPFVSKQDPLSLTQKSETKQNSQKVSIKQGELKSVIKQPIVLTKEVKPPLKPVSGKPSSAKSQSISSALDIKAKATQFIPTTANMIKRPPSSTSIQSQNNYINNYRPPSSSSIQSAKEAPRRNTSQSVRDQKMPSINSDIQKLPPINLNNLLENKKSISSIQSGSTQTSAQKRASSSHRGTKSISGNITKQINNNNNNSFSKF